MKVIPAINCQYKDFECVAEKVRAAEKFSDWVHLDVADAKFTYNKTWDEAARWPELKTKLNLEVHLMVEEPEKISELWLKAGAKRLIVHLETISEKSFREISALAKNFGAEIMISSNPETPAEDMRPYFGKISGFQVLAVHPGLAGQKFQASALEKIKFLRRELPNATIEVDGGVNLETAKLVKDAGADVVAAASYVFGSDNPEKAYQELSKT